MKQLLYLVLPIILLLGSRITGIAQTLAVGDIAIVRMNEDSPSDGFSFVTFVPISSGTILYFTEEGWFGSPSWNGNSESHLKYTAPTGGLSAGNVVHIDENVDGTTFTISGSGGTVVYAWSTSGFNLSGGDQILAYQTSESSKPASPNFIAGLTMNDGNSVSEPNDPATGWTSSSASSTNGVNVSRLPNGLTNGTNCISVFPDYTVLTEKDNARYNCTLTNGTKTALLAAINNHDNWLYDDATNYATSSVCSFTVTSASPEMNVQGNGTSIIDGDATPSASDHTDFGSVTVASGSIVRTFTIQNTGAGSLVLSGTPIVAVSGSSDFTVTTQPTSPVAATSGSTTFQVTFDPSASGTRSATLSIANNDTDENPYNFSIQGVGTAPAPEMKISGNSVEIADGDATPSISDHTDFGFADISTGSVAYTFTIENQGLAALTLSGTPKVSVGGANPSDFSVIVQPSSPIAVSGSTTFQVTFNPASTGARSATLSIANDDTNEDPYNFTIQGYGTSKNLVVGDIAFIGYNSDDPDGFSFITLTDIPAYEMIYFTEEGWNGSAWSGSPDETHYSWHAPSGGLPIGSIVSIYESSANVLTASSGTMSGLLAGTNLFYNTGDQVLAYQSGSGVDPASPTFIAGLHSDYNSLNYNPTTTWSTSALSSESTLSTVPTGLTNGQDCVSLYPATTENDNAKYTGSLTGTSDAIRLAVNTYTNWSSKSDTYYDISSAGYATPSISYSPEMNVQGNSTNIADGDASPATADHTDFGSVNVTSGTVSRTFTIQNTGAGSLTLSGNPKVAVSGTNSSDFTVTTQPTSPVAITTGTTTFTVQFDPIAQGLRVATISIPNNDANENPYDFSIQGTGLIAPTITTQAVSNIGSTNAIGNGIITDLGIPNPTSFGVCWSTTGTTSITDSKSDNGAASVTGAFTSSMTSLSPNTTYYVRAYATSTAGTSYGDQVSFTTITAGTFTGATDTDWAKATNWAGGSVPTPATDVTIPSGKNPVIGATTTASCNNLTVIGNLTIQSSSSGTGSLIVSGTSTGSVTCQRYLTGSIWHMLSPIAAGGSISTFIQVTSNAISLSGSNYGMMDYNETANAWNNYFTTSTSGIFTAGKGYGLRRSSDGVVTFTGMLASGTNTVAITKGGTEGWSLIGNPYTSAIYMNTSANSSFNFLKTNAIEASKLDASYACIYLWDVTSETYKILGNASYSGRDLDINVFAPGQAFFVKAASAGTVEFNKTMQVSQTGSTFKVPASTTSWPSITLTATNVETSSSAIITFDENRTNGLDPTYDAGLLYGTNGLSLYTRLVEDNGVDFAIQCLPVKYANLVIPVGVDCKTGGDVTFSAESIELPAGCNVVLEDNTTGTFTSLAGGATYKVTLPPETRGIGRFYIRTGENLTTGTLKRTSSIGNLKAYPVKGAILIEGEVSDQAIATLYNLQGLRVHVQPLKKGLMNTFSCPNLMDGVYVLKIQQDGETLIRKLLKK